MSANTAKIVLANQKLRWSSPVLFNDPFDVPRQLVPECTALDIGSSIVLKLAKFLEFPNIDISNMSAKLQEGIGFLRELFPEGAPKELLDKLKAQNENPPLGVNSKVQLQNLKDIWEQDILRRRILCLTESPFITSMWNHYADSYKGVVLEFSCIDELDSAWLIARPIEYSDVLPMTYTADGLADLILLNHQSQMDYLTHTVTYLKTTEWITEKEWRVSSFQEPHEEGLFSDYSFNSRELKSIILGPMINHNDEAEILKLSARYENVNNFRATIGSSRKIEIQNL
jgi:hypothetical protein